MGNYLANLCPFECHVLVGFRPPADDCLSYNKSPNSRPTPSDRRCYPTVDRKTTVRTVSNKKKNDFGLGLFGGGQP
jgi:hypothetical protein